MVWPGAFFCLQKTREEFEEDRFFVAARFSIVACGFQIQKSARAISIAKPQLTGYHRAPRKQFALHCCFSIGNPQSPIRNSLYLARNLLGDPSAPIATV